MFSFSPQRSVLGFFLKAGFAAVALAAFLSLPLACGPDGEHRAVDFTSRPVSLPVSAKNIPQEGRLRVAVAAMISPKETLIHYRELLEYLGRESGQTISLLQRRTYGEVNDLFPRGEVDLAFLCSGPYAVARGRIGFLAIAVPVVRGEPFYRAYLIVPRQSPATGIEDLQGKVFAFTDPESNTGHLVPRYWLAARGERPETFFRKTIFTYSHDNSILSVVRGLVDGAAVDGHQWEFFARNRPELTSPGRILLRSEPFGSPPIVVSPALSVALRTRLREILLSMHTDPEGQRILQALGIDRFVAPEESWYEPIRRMYAVLNLGGGS